MSEYYKLRKDLSIEVNGKKLFKIEATKNIEEKGISKGYIGGYVESKKNLSGNAWVSGNAKVFGNAKVSDNARVLDNARVFGDAEVFGDEIKARDDIYNITSNSQYNITITPNFIKIGCEFHKKTEWFKFNDESILEMDSQKALDFWKKWKPILKAICE